MDNLSEPQVRQRERTQHCQWTVCVCVYIGISRSSCRHSGRDTFGGNHQICTDLECNPLAWWFVFFFPFSDEIPDKSMMFSCFKSTRVSLFNWWNASSSPTGTTEKTPVWNSISTQRREEGAQNLLAKRDYKWMQEYHASWKTKTKNQLKAHSSLLFPSLECNVGDWKAQTRAPSTILTTRVLYFLESSKPEIECSEPDTVCNKYYLPYDLIFLSFNYKYFDFEWYLSMCTPR